MNDNDKDPAASGEAQVSRKEFEALTGQLSSVVSLLSQLQANITQLTAEKEAAEAKVRQLEEELNASKDEIALGAAAAPVESERQPVAVAETSRRPAGSVMTLNIAGVDYQFRWAPAGTFTMGSPESEHERGEDEIPHEVTLTRGFWLLETPVTQRMWTSIMGANPSWFTGAQLESLYVFDDVKRSADNFPVEQVSWFDAQEFIRKLNEHIDLRSGMKFRLPFEAEWEYACRAGQAFTYSGGDELEAVGWYKNNSGDGGSLSAASTHEVGSLQANAWGLYDMSGNVWEWCQDRYGDYTADPVVDPQGPAEGTYRIRRGGSWYASASYCRCAYRNFYGPEYRGSRVGFRILLEAND